jgi:TPR repeat protein
MYMKGYGVEPDDIFALRYFRLAAKAGNQSAQGLLADAYDKGWFGLPIDPNEAEKWRQKANK